ncbi:MAG TPA: hypothetical protein VGQ27_10075 [Steroidobacteraceae bacterium]|nr:hypothetical protein [Steroidobacteraceae bacterium]
MNSPPPSRGLRLVAVIFSGLISLGGALVVLFGMGGSPDSRVAAAWCLVQFLSGVWAGALGANSPLLHGLVAGIPSLLLGFLVASVLAPQLILMCFFIVPAAALVAAALMRFSRQRRSR